MSDLSNTYEKASKKQKKGGWGSLRRSPPGEGTPSNTPSDAKKGRAKREYPTPGFVLTRITRSTGRSSYEIRQKVQVLEFSRLPCADGQPVAHRLTCDIASRVFVGRSTEVVRDISLMERFSM